MKVDVLLGLQWGDEGKGKVVDVLTPRYDVVARFQGGPNAGHTLEFEGQKYVLRSIPSGIFQGNKVNIIGNGVVLDPALFKAEAEALEASGHPLKERLHISKKAHLILPTHRILDAAYEAAKGDAKVGTTGKGIGPTYTDKVSRNGVRVGDILHNFEEVYGKAKARHEQILKSLNYEYDITELEKQWLEGIEYLKQFHLVDSEHEINNLLKSGKSVLCEGAQGTMLDVDFGSYPFVTSSNTICAGACTGLGIGPNKIGNVYGIMKAYCTRVGAGPFPTELFDETGKKIRDLGHEYGAVTGRERRCGWIDKDGEREPLDPWNHNMIVFKPAGKIGFIQPSIEDNELFEEDNVDYMNAGNGIRIAKWRTGESTGQKAGEYTQGSARLIPVITEINGIVCLQVRGFEEPEEAVEGVTFYTKEQFDQKAAAASLVG
jgi:adenylosuccinate synthase